MSFSLVAITDRKQCREPLEERVLLLMEAGIDKVIVREKDLGDEAYAELLARIIDALDAADVSSLPDNEAVKPYKNRLVVHSRPFIAQRFSIQNLQVSINTLEEKPYLASDFKTLGVSIHHLDEAFKAQELGASYVIAGHIYQTNSKPGLEPRGLDFLKEIAEKSNLPVFAIGGINDRNIQDVKDAGASGACLLSSFMTCSNPKTYGAKLKALTGESSETQK